MQQSCDKCFHVIVLNTQINLMTQTWKFYMWLVSKVKLWALPKVAHSNQELFECTSVLTFNFRFISNISTLIVALYSLISSFMCYVREFRWIFSSSYTLLGDWRYFFPFFFQFIYYIFGKLHLLKCVIFFKPCDKCSWGKSSMYCWETTHNYVFCFLKSLNTYLTTSQSR